MLAYLLVLVEDAHRHLRAGHLPTILTDGYDGYEPAILEAFGPQYRAPTSSGPGRPRLPVLRWPQGLAYGQVIKSSPDKSSEAIHLKVIRGKVHLEHV